MNTKEYVVIRAGLHHQTDEMIKSREFEIGETIELTDAQAKARSGKIQTIEEFLNENPQEEVEEEGEEEEGEIEPKPKSKSKSKRNK